MSFSGALTLTDLNDFITPSQACIKPVEEVKSVERVQEPGAAAIHIDSAGGYYEVGHTARTKLQTAEISLNDCLACSSSGFVRCLIVVGLSDRMLKFTQMERRDFMPVFDVMVLDISDQGSMKVKADIKYKSNWQQGALKAQRRNKWICALKNELKSALIFGPSGNPDAPAAGPQKITLVPFTEAPPSSSTANSPSPQPTREYNLTDSHAAMLNQGTQGVFGEESEMRMPAPMSSGSATPAQEAVLRQRAPGLGAPSSSSSGGLMPQPSRYGSASSGEVIEMQQQQQQGRQLR